jgi:hypothetical protein
MNLDPLHLLIYFNGSHIHETKICNTMMEAIEDMLLNNREYGRFSLYNCKINHNNFSIVEQIEILDSTIKYVHLESWGSMCIKFEVVNNIVKLPFGIITSPSLYFDLNIHCFREPECKEEIKNVTYEVTGITVDNNIHKKLFKIFNDLHLELPVDMYIFNFWFISGTLSISKHVCKEKARIKLQHSFRKFLFKRKMNRARIMKNIF